VDADPSWKGAQAMPRTRRQPRQPEPPIYTFRVRNLGGCLSPRMRARCGAKSTWQRIRPSRT